ncbi:Rho-related GTP-binding protein RhoV [Heterocephalus glaber]|uniref:Rho-related GTP-binding protein RhoV n=1 Tax=Heterocephalus glaber TaxID=10181 RepID=G5BM04_HETGA|nr:Rho-related GTP-binding protein RhoV [Heterocephalus glaber]
MSVSTKIPRFGDSLSSYLGGSLRISFRLRFFLSAFCCGQASREDRAVQVLVDGAPVRIELWDTAGQEDFDRLRSLCYPDTDVFLACFSVVQPSSFQNITEKWLPEIRTHNPQAPVLLVGTQADLRDDVNVLIQLDQGGREGPVPQPQAQGLAEKIRACCYLECSALTQKNLKEVFDSAILSAIEHKARLEKKLNAKGVRTLSRCRWKKFFCFV